MSKTSRPVPAQKGKTKTTVTPLGDRILIRRTVAGEKSKGGIFLPDSAKEKPAEGTVIAVGAGRLNDKGERLEMTVKVDDRVLFSSYAGSEIKLDGEDYLIMGEDEVFAVVD
jgi:chaperonin GroES